MTIPAGFCKALNPYSPQRRWVARVGLLVALVWMPAAVAETPSARAEEPSARAEWFRGPIADAGWRLDASVFECRLVQPIPRFGDAVFTRRAGEQQRFVLHQANRLLAEGEASIRAEHPEWRETAQPELLDPVSVQTGEQALALDWQRSQRLAAELRTGRRLIISHAPWDSRVQAVEIVLEPVGFREGMDGFNECLAGLLPVNFDQVQRNALYFPAGNNDLPESELEKLDQVALYASADDAVTHFYVDGHTDGVGLRAENLELSQKRAEMVTQYLIERGVPERKIITRWHGERYPVGSNREPEGRAENRRVTVRLERRDERLSALDN